MAAEARVSRWYFGGLASCGAACCTHPLDLLKVHLQTQQEVKLRMTGMALRVVRSDGVLALYNGLSASLCRQMTYSLTRFAIYETVRDHVAKGSEGPLPFYKKVLLGSISGCIGGFVGTPADMVNVRMQNDMKLPPNQRRNYAHAMDGLYRVAREEGLKKLFSGASMASSRGMLVTVGQVGLLLAVGLPGQHLGGPPSAPGEVGEEGSGHGPQVGAGAVGRPLPVRASPVCPVTVTGGDLQSRHLVSPGDVPVGPCLPSWGRGPSHRPCSPLPPTAVLLRSGQAAGPQHRVPV
ncbi:mitochondrial dicarboxylate carrier isoform X1 [Neomonachus schauinslandi]|uniref:Mitochondrial dicarboxylate carrier isoform X1 n=1 Tax=Neomonachus schauinslandi TaxID=29088 RepID=A0A8M1MZ57_NEOSC|nr:mitochondrial dicarboxylate carrier isoform X1 [Neomonachus schauinslandi]